METVLSVNNITKTFGDYKAVDNISFEVKKGRIFGLLGPNGAGKTTTIRMITNILVPDSGDISINGKPVNSEMQNFIGYLPEERGLYKKMKVIDQLHYFAMLKGVSKSEANKRAKFWLNELGAADWESKKIQELSKGMAQKVQFISTILHEPDVLILDEPFSGFDPINTSMLKSIILDMNKRGITIILSTHVMEQVEQMCDDIVLFNKGNAVLKGDIRNIKSKYGRDTVIIEFDGDPSFIDGLKGITISNRTNSRIEFRITDNELTSNMILAKAMEKAEVYRYEIEEPSINEIFIEEVGRDNLPKEILS